MRFPAIHDGTVEQKMSKRQSGIRWDRVVEGSMEGQRGAPGRDNVDRWM